MFGHVNILITKIYVTVIHKLDIKYLGLLYI